MSTATQGTGRKAPGKPARARPPDTCRLTLTIRGVAYSVRPVACPTGRAWQLRNAGTGATYDVAETEHGPECDCADATYRHGDGGTFCKHIRALSALTLITLDAEAPHRAWPVWTEAHTYAPGR
jgi:hypothetical protein